MIGDEVTSACCQTCDWSAWRDEDARGRHVAIGRALDVAGAAVAGGAVMDYLGNREGTVMEWARPREGRREYFVEPSVVRALVCACLLMALAACGYDARFAACAVRCTQSSGCPGELVCGSENLCRPPGETCSYDGGRDAASACMNFGNPIIDLALNKPARADGEIDAGGLAKNGNDGNDGTRWNTGDGTPGHWWDVDLGADHLLESVNTLWEYDGVNYKFYVSISSDGTNFTTAIDRTADARTARARMDMFPGGTCTRYVRITKTDTTGYWAILYTVKVMGRDCGTLDSDGDGIPDCRDNCPTIANPDQMPGCT